MDLFPSIIHHLSGYTPTFLEGTSLFLNEKPPFVITARFNAGLAPYEFFIQNGTNKMIAQFNTKEMDVMQSLRIISLRDKEDVSQKDLNIKEEFGAALHYLFGFDLSE